jgi:nucleoid DNA-binding protein
MITPLLIRALLEESAVTITGLGTFSVKKLPSQIKEEVIFPPQNIIEFEYSKGVEGFNFVSKLSQWEQIRIDEAQIKVVEWLELLEKGLNDNKSIFFDDFGTFSKNEAGQIVFQSVINSQLNIENEGFEPVLVPAKDKKIVKDKRLILKKRARKRDKFWFVFTILAASILLCVLFVKDFIPDFYQTFVAKKEKMGAMKDTAKEEVDYLDNTAEIQANEAIQTLHSENENIVSANVPVVNQNLNTLPKSNEVYLSFQQGKYYVIAGSFVNEEDALRHIKQKKLEKYNAKLVIHPQSQRLRVCIGVFDNEKDAELFAAQIDKNYWVLK